LIVELSLHVLDHRAHRHFFIREVLKTVYKELAILGIVEWMVWIVQKYWKSGKDLYKSELGQTFTQIHWFLFFTAIVNATLCSILYRCCSWQTQRWWVKTEDLEINHYVELREEFDKAQLERGHNLSDDKQTLSLGKALKGIIRFCRNPKKEHLYKRLLIQVRFHELRIRFINANKLPLTFKISEYLVKCEQEVLARIVKISMFVWLALVAIANLAYFSLSMVYLRYSNSLDLSAEAATFFYCLCGFLVALGCVIWLKVDWIFSQIIHKDFIIAKCEENTTSSPQLQLFWWSYPEFLIGLVQFMLFAFSMLLAFLFEFHQSITTNAENSVQCAWSMVIVCLLCYSVFIFFMARAIPRFTLCTCIGQLVKKKKLRELSAYYRLKAATRKKETGNQVSGGGSIATSQERSNHISSHVLPNDTFPNQNTSIQPGDEGCTRSESDLRRFERLANLVALPTNELPKTTNIQEPHPTKRLFFSQRVEAFFLAKHFRLIDLVFGTMVCFFLVGLRMEMLLVLSGVLKPAIKTANCSICIADDKDKCSGSSPFNAICSETGTCYDIPNSAAKWFFGLECIWLILIVIGGFLKMYAFGDFKGLVRRASFFCSGLFDVMIGLLCLFLLVIAEAQRSQNAGHYTGPIALGLGPGKIEPFTSFIALRAFGIPLGQALSIWMSKLQWIYLEDDKPLETCNEAKNHKSHSDSTLGQEKGTVAELWLIAVGKFPDIVERYGEFSIELFQAMLGVAHTDSTTYSEAEEPPLPLPLQNHSLSAKNTSWPEDESVAKLESAEELYHSQTSNQRYATQEPTLKMYQDVVETHASSFLGKNRSLVKARNAAGKNEPATFTSFELDEESLESQLHGNYSDNVITLIEPDATLICSMRRCERILLPLLLEWAIVDIVLTEFELVYLDASAPEEMNAGGFNTLMRKRQIRDNIIATNGGMRMRLRDVVVGRKIVGHVDLRLISSVKVLCHLAPLVAEKMTNDDENNRLDFQSEYWTPCKREWNAASANMLNEKRWRRVEENQLKITSPQGELYFRFFCDLESAEQTERGATPSQGLFTEAFAWCQTLAHYSTGIEILRYAIRLKK